MSSSTLNAIIRTLQPALLLAVLVSIISFAFMIFRWKRPQRRGHAIRLLLSVAATACIIALLNWSVAREYLARMESERAARYAEQGIVQVGDPSPQFTITDTEGTEFSLTAAKGQVLLINFFATWCGPCRKELPHIEKIWNDYRDSGKFRVLVIGFKESMDSVRRFRTDNQFSLSMAPDETGEVFALFAKQRAVIPRTFILSPNGDIVYAKAEFYDRDANELRSVLARELAR
jgi:peroxiredoxin